MNSKLLRAKAEQILASSLIDDGDESQSRRQLHELQVHQVELEMQNIELESQNEAIRAADSAYQSLLESGKVLEFKHIQLQTLIKTTSDLVWLKSVTGVYQNCNPRFESFFGTTIDNILGKTDYDFVEKTSADSSRFYDLAAMQSNKPLVNEEQVTFVDGHTERLEITKTAMFDQDDNLIGVLGIGHDITARKQAEEKLRQAEEKLRQAEEKLRQSEEKLRKVKTK
jgi:PAS domain S-box-containing protein